MSGMEAESEREARTHEGEPSRRQALGLILGGAMVALGRPERASARGDLPSAYADVLVAELKDLPPGAVRPAEFHEMPVLVLNVEGTIEVLSAICTHEGCEVAWDAERKLLQCPCHGGDRKSVV